MTGRTGIRALNSFFHNHYVLIFIFYFPLLDLFYFICFLPLPVIIYFSSTILIDVFNFYHTYLAYNLKMNICTLS